MGVRLTAWLRALAWVMLVWPTGLLAQPQGGTEHQAAAKVWTLEVQGAISPATADLIGRTLEEAARASADLLVILLDTPGGLDKSMRVIIQGILASPVPVVTYVHPQGARAASAGTYILYASHIAAMAPATNLGSATPVEIGGPPQTPTPQPAPDQPESPQTPEERLSTMERKQINDAVAYIRGLAELRGRNADWAEAAVRQAANVDAREALKLQVINLVATDLEDLLAQLDGQRVEVAGGERTLALQIYQVNRVEPDWRNQFLAIITDPSIAYILLLIGIYGLILEFYNSGMGFPGILGGICLLLALYSLQMLPISYVGLGLVGIGIALMVAEAFAPSFGVLGIGGAIAFAIGSVLLMDTSLPAFQIAWPIILGVTITSVLVLCILLGMIYKARRSPVVSGTEAMLGTLAEAVEDFEGEGRVIAQGEIWRAYSPRPVRQGERVRIIAVRGLTLHVEAEP